MTRSCLPGRADRPCHEGEQSARTQHPPGGEAIGLSRPGHQGRHCTSQPDSAAPDPERDDFLIGAEAVRAFVAREWKRQLDYRLKKEVWTYSGDQVAILFEYEWHDAESGQWISTYGEEHWEIALDGLMSRLSANGRDIVMDEANS